MQALLTSGAIADVMVALIVFEALALAVKRRQRLWLALPSLCAGMCMALALRCALTGADWPWLALCLSASGLAHGVDVWRRWSS